MKWPFGKEVTQVPVEEKKYYRFPKINVERWEVNDHNYNRDRIKIVRDNISYDVLLERSHSDLGLITVKFNIDDVIFVVAERKTNNTYGNYDKRSDYITWELVLTVNDVEMYKGDGEVQSIKDGVRSHIADALNHAMKNFELAVYEHELEWAERKHLKLRRQQIDNDLKVLEAERKLMDRHYKEKHNG